MADDLESTTEPCDGKSPWGSIYALVVLELAALVGALYALTRWAS